MVRHSQNSFRYCGAVEVTDNTKVLRECWRKTRDTDCLLLTIACHSVCVTHEACLADATLGTVVRSAIDAPALAVITLCHIYDIYF